MYMKITSTLLFISQVFGHPSDRSEFVVGGQEADIEQFKHQALFFLNEFPLCGAAIISWKFALTARHCIPPFGPAAYNIRAGSADRRTMLRWSIKELYRYPYALDHDNDVGLIEIEGSFDDRQNGFIHPIQLLSPNVLVPGGSEVLVSGWGYRDINDVDLPFHLHYTKLQFLKWERCRQEIPFLTRNMICAVGDGISAACRGDNGGALVYNDLIIGIVISTNHQNCKDSISVYADLTSPTIHEFIVNVTGGP